jgi:hypothetical protein
MLYCSSDAVASTLVAVQESDESGSVAGDESRSVVEERCRTAGAHTGGLE